MSTRADIRVIIPADNGYCRQIIRGVYQFAAARGNWRITRQAPADVADARDLARADGIIFLRAGGSFGAEALVPLAVALVDVSNAEAVPGVCRIESDDAAAGRLAAEHLLAYGHRHFAWAGLRSPLYSERRRLGFRTRLAQAGFTPAERMLYEGRREAGGWRNQRELTRDWLIGLPRPCGLLVCSDNDALHVIDIAADAGLSIPDDLAVVGVDDDELTCHLCDPPLTSVRLDGVAVGTAAAVALDRLLDGAVPPPPSAIAPARLSVRGSTSAHPIADPVVRAAMAWLRQRSQDEVRMAECAAAIGTSERNLRLRFRQALECSPHQALLGLRIAHAERLLSGSDLPLRVIATRCGFSSASHLCSAFRQAHGRTPESWRQQRRETTRNEALQSADTL